MTLALFIVLAVANGLLIGLGRALNGRLSATIGPIATTTWNHVLGCACLLPPVLLLGPGAAANLGAVPLTGWIGGVLGVAFVALNSVVVGRLGTGRTTGLVIAGQMLTSLAIDAVTRGAASPLGVAGAVLILAGVVLARPRRQTASN